METRSKVKNVVYKCSEAKKVVCEATSDSPYSPSTTSMNAMANMTHQHSEFKDIMQLIWKRLNDVGKDWPHVHKSLVVLEYLIKCGHQKVSEECMRNIHTIQTLKDFQYFEDDKDLGIGVREKSKTLVALLTDPDLLRNEQEKGEKVKEKSLRDVRTTATTSDEHKPKFKSSNTPSLFTHLSNDSLKNNKRKRSKAFPDACVDDKTKLLKENNMISMLKDGKSKDGESIIVLKDGRTNAESLHNEDKDGESIIIIEDDSTNAESLHNEDKDGESIIVIEDDSTDAETNYDEGSLFWVKLKGHHIWPCMVYRSPENKHIRTSFVHVVYFGEEVERGWVAMRRIRPYLGFTEFIENVVKYIGRKQTQFKESFLVAVREADAALPMSRIERLNKYGFDYHV